MLYKSANFDRLTILCTTKLNFSNKSSRFISSNCQMSAPDWYTIRCAGTFIIRTSSASISFMRSSIFLTICRAALCVIVTADWFSDWKSRDQLLIDSTCVTNPRQISYLYLSTLSSTSQSRAKLTTPILYVI